MSDWIIFHPLQIKGMLTLKARDPSLARSLISFASKIQSTFKGRLVALYVAGHPSMEVEGYNALIVLREVRPGDQEEAVKLAIESCRDLRPEEQIAPLVVREGELEEMGIDDLLVSPLGWNVAVRRFSKLLKKAFKGRLVALYVAGHPSMEVEGYNALIVLREVRPGDQEEAVKLAIESCRDLRPEEQIAPLVVREGEEIPPEFRKEI